MNDNRKQRIAIGAIADGDGLRRIVGEFQRLSSLQFSPSNAVLLCKPRALDGWLREFLSERPEEDQAQWPEVVVLSAEDGGWTMPGSDATRGTDLLLSISQMVHFDQWIEPAFVDDLNRHLDDGACLLCAPINSDELEREVCRALLSHAAGRVQAHDFPQV